MHFAFPGSLDTLTGGTIYDRQLIDNLRLLGLDVATLALSGQFPFPDARALQETREALSALQDDAVVIIDGLALGAFDELTAAQAQRLRIIALCHHPLELESGLQPQQQERFHVSEQRVLQGARAVLVTSEHTRQTVIAAFALSPERVIVARPGTGRIPFADCNGHPPRLLALGSLIRRKAHNVLIDALAPLTHLPWQARFAGSAAFDPAWSDQLQQQVDRLGLQSRICFAGTVDDPALEFRAADLFVLPSRYEGYGMVFAEALAAGLPVIAARAGAVPDLVPESAGLLVPPDDARALTVALRTLLTQENLRRQLQAGARRAAAALPTWSDTAGRVAHLIDAVRSA